MNKNKWVEKLKSIPAVEPAITRMPASVRPRVSQPIPQYRSITCNDM